MREGIGSVFLYNIIIIFIVITFGFLSASLSYMKAFKVNGKIANSLEKYEGFNSFSNAEITETLNTIGYRFGEADCRVRRHNGNEYTAVNNQLNSGANIIHDYCIYEYTKGNDYKNGYFTYGIVTYIYVDIPVLGGLFKIPVYSETESIFKFSPDEFNY